MGKLNLNRICKLVNVSTSNSKSVADLFATDLEYSIVKYNSMTTPNTVSKSYKPSSLHCIRNMYYQVTGKEVEQNSSITADFIGICESGTGRHNDIQESIIHMKDVGIDCEYINVADYVKEHNLPNLEIIEQCGHETKLFNSKYNIRFLCDGIIKYKGEYYIFEYKTEASFKWNSRDNVDDGHKLQATAYSLSFGLNNVIFLYENRDVCTKKCYLFEVTDDMRNDLIEKLTICDKYVAKNLVPPKPLDLPVKYCKYCGYADMCRKDDISEKAEFR